jgi:hypothetical protein
MSEERIYVVDRVEGGNAVLIGDDRSEQLLPLRDLPPGTAEGTVLRVWTKGSDVDWQSAIADAAEQSRRVESAQRRMDQLRKRDPGGDLKL